MTDSLEPEDIYQWKEAFEKGPSASKGAQTLLKTAYESERINAYWDEVSNSPESTTV